MNNATEERIQALEIALNNEARERDFYLKHSRKTSNPLGKSMFESIANDEHEHYQRILTLHAKLKETGTWPESIPLIVKGTNVKSTLEKVLNDVDALPQADDDDVEAVKIAIDFEQKGVAFYEKLRSSVDNPQEKSFYATLVAMEREHLLSLQDTYEFFRDPEGWYRYKERQHLDGA